MKGLVALVAALFSFALMGSGVALAQGSTPMAGTFPVTPDPAECQVEERAREEFLVLNAEATPEEFATPVGTAVEVPLGEAADAETVAGVVATAREVLACFNAGDFPRALSLFTDDAIRTLTEEDPISEEELSAFLAATPEAVPAGQQSTLPRGHGRDGAGERAGRRVFGHDRPVRRTGHHLRYLHPRR